MNWPAGHDIEYWSYIIAFGGYRLNIHSVPFSICETECFVVYVQTVGIVGIICTRWNLPEYGSIQ
jgi:hypothetical protein